MPAIRFSSAAYFVEDDGLVVRLVEPSQFVFMRDKEARLRSVAQRPRGFSGSGRPADDNVVSSAWSRDRCKKLEVRNGSLSRIVIVRFSAGGVAYLPEFFGVGVWNSFAKCKCVPVPFSRSSFAFSNIVALRPSSSARDNCIFRRAIFVDNRASLILAAVIDAGSPRCAGLIVPMSSIEVEEIELSLESSSKFNGGVQVVTSVLMLFSGDDAFLKIGEVAEEVP